MDIETLLDQLEVVISVSPEQRVQRELDKLKNIAEVNPAEALSIGLAQCCAYTRYIKGISRNTGMSELEFVEKLGELLNIMAASCGIRTRSEVHHE